MIALRLSAAVAPYMDEIRVKRLAGWRWGDIKSALGLECTDNALALAVRRCRWQAEQLPFPELKASKEAVRPSRPLQRIGDKPKSGDVDWTALHESNQKELESIVWEG